MTTNTTKIKTIGYHIPSGGNMLNSIGTQLTKTSNPNLAKALGATENTEEGETGQTITESCNFRL
jgi:hypothetical protein